MKRSGFKPKPRPPRALVPAYTLARPCQPARIATDARPVPKEAPLRSEPYRRLVAALPCIRCGISGFSNHAHANTGKGAGIKVDDRFAFPLCVDRPGVRGCHSLFDAGRVFTKEERRIAEIKWSRDTARQIYAAGDWPPGLPLLPGMLDDDGQREMAAGPRL